MFFIFSSTSSCITLLYPLSTVFLRIVCMYVCIFLSYLSRDSFFLLVNSILFKLKTVIWVPRVPNLLITVNPFVTHSTVWHNFDHVIFFYYGNVNIGLGFFNKINIFPEFLALLININIKRWIFREVLQFLRYLSGLFCSEHMTMCDIQVTTVTD